jgi:hypothetical protein
MRMSMKVIAAGAAILASPAMAHDTWIAKTWRTAPVPLSNNVYWSLGYRNYPHQHPYEHAYGAAPPAYQHAPGPVLNGTRPQANDCVHVTFPQCTGGG